MPENNHVTRPYGVWRLVNCKTIHPQINRFCVGQIPERKGMVIKMDNVAYSINLADGRNIWPSADDGKVVVNQITLQKSEIIPENSTIHNINLQIVFGRVGLKQNDTDEIIYTSGNVISIPAKTKICLSNQFEEESTIYLVRI